MPRNQAVHSLELRRIDGRLLGRAPCLMTGYETILQEHQDLAGILLFNTPLDAGKAIDAVVLNEGARFAITHFWCGAPLLWGEGWQALEEDSESDE
jgi:hypothetical protein